MCERLISKMFLVDNGQYFVNLIAYEAKMNNKTAGIALCLLLWACGGDDDSPANAGGGSGGAAAGTGGTAAGLAGSGGSVAGTSGSGGASGGTGGSVAGSSGAGGSTAGAGGSSAGTGGTNTTNCGVITPTGDPALINLNTLTFYAGEMLEGAAPELIAFSFLNTAPGAYDLSDPASSIADCSNNCSTFSIDFDGATEQKLFMATSGTVTVGSAVGGDLTALNQGSAENVIYVEIIITPDYQVEIVPDGACYALASAQWDLTGYAATCDAPVDLMNVPSGGSCVAIGGEHTCNPVTNEGCTQDQACDFSNADYAFRCLDVGTEDLCGQCSNGDSPFCKAGMVCDNQGSGVCNRYCCTDEDCGATGRCLPFLAGAGVCRTGPLYRVCCIGVNAERVQCSPSASIGGRRGCWHTTACPWAAFYTKWAVSN